MSDSSGGNDDPIDRRAVVTRHSPEKRSIQPTSPFQVGNGSIAVGVDETGLQTFADAWTNTLLEWGWHTAPPPVEGGVDAYERSVAESHGRELRYMLPNDDQSELTEWLRANPHRVNLGRIGFRVLGDDAPVLTPETVDVDAQELDLWRGVVTSEFALAGERVAVETSVHPYRNALAARVDSPLVADGRLGVDLRFPAPDDAYMATRVGDYDRPAAHDTVTRDLGERAVGFERHMDDDSYGVTLEWTDAAAVERASEHRFTLAADGGSTLAFVCSFTPDAPAEPTALTPARVGRAAAEHWPAFWRTGGAIDLSESEDPRWREPERRAVLSQYVLAVTRPGAHRPRRAGS